MEQKVTRTERGGPALPADGSAPVPARAWLGLIPLALAAMMDGVDAMVVTVASPTISVEMDTGLSQLQWVTTGYMLAYAATLLAAGKLGDRYGHRRIFLIGMVGFMASSVLVGLSQSIGMLIVWRIVQGICGASLLPAALAILRLTFPEDKLKVAIGVFMGTFALSAAAGPFLGGVVVQYAGWRWAFFINVIVGAIAVLLTLILVRPTPAADADRPLDVPGIGLIAVTLSALVLGINQAAVKGWGGALPVGCFVVAVVFAALFILRERTVREPLVPLRLFRSRAFVAGSLLILVGSGLMFAVWFYLALHLQNVQGATPLRTGVQLLIIPAAGLIFAPLGGVLNQKLGPRPPLIAGLVLLFGGLFGLTRMTIDADFSSIWPYLLMLGASMSFIVPIGTEVVISSARKSEAGVASAIGETMGSLGPALGVTSVGTIISFVISGGLAQRLADAGVPKDLADRVYSDVESVAQGTVPTPPEASPSVAATIVREAHQAFTDGLHTGLWAAMAVLVFVCLPLVLLIRPNATEAAESTTDEAGVRAGASAG
jgi:EmrB/QacA subfamily drug resistance transporter